MGENRKFYKDLENSSFQDDWECKGTFEMYHGNQKESSNQVVITHEEIHILRRQTSRNLLHKVPPGSRPYVCNERRKGHGRRNLLVIRKFTLARNLMNVSTVGSLSITVPILLIRELIVGKDPMNVKNVERPLLLFHSLHQRIHTGEKHCESEDVGKPLFGSHNSVSIIELILVKNTINVLNKEKLLVTYH